MLKRYSVLRLLVALLILAALDQAPRAASWPLAEPWQPVLPELSFPPNAQP